LGKIALLLIAGIVVVGAYFYFKKGKGFGLGNILSGGSSSSSDSVADVISSGTSTSLTIPTPPVGFRSHNIVGVTKGCAPYDIECLQQQQLVNTSGH